MNEDELKKIIELASYPNPPSVDKEENNKFYENAFTKIASGKILTWNWAAFFFGMLWMLYRKMYGLAFFIPLLLCLSILLIGYVGEDSLLLEIIKVLLFIGWLLSWLAPGMLSNYLYYKDLQRKARIGYNLIHNKPTDSITAWLALLIPLNFLYCLGRWIYSRKQIAGIKKQMAVNPSDAVTK